jgi:hypothetical protein
MRTSDVIFLILMVVLTIRFGVEYGKKGSILTLFCGCMNAACATRIILKLVLR